MRRGWLAYVAGAQMAVASQVFPASAVCYTAALAQTGEMETQQRFHALIDAPKDVGHSHFGR